MSEFAQGPEVFSAPPPTASASGLTENVAGALAYVTIIPAIVFLVLEPYNKSPFIRFHAFQCLGLSVVAFVSSIIWVIPILGWIIGLLMIPILFVVWILCIVKAYQGKYFQLPILGPFVANLAK
jgi:uncharacterized membrane protein